MRDLSRRARVLLAGTAVGVLGSGLAGAIVLPVAAQTSSASKAQEASLLPITVCVTVREIHFGPVCIKLL